MKFINQCLATVFWGFIVFVFVIPYFGSLGARSLNPFQNIGEAFGLVEEKTTFDYMREDFDNQIRPLSQAIDGLREQINTMEVPTFRPINNPSAVLPLPTANSGGGHGTYRKDPKILDLKPRTVRIPPKKPFWDQVEQQMYGDEGSPYSEDPYTAREQIKREAYANSNRNHRQRIEKEGIDLNKIRAEADLVYNRLQQNFIQRDIQRKKDEQARIDQINRNNKWTFDDPMSMAQQWAPYFEDHIKKCHGGINNCKSTAWWAFCRACP